jgi:hypothetical protein
MGIQFDKLEELFRTCGVKANTRILDIGCSNIHTLEPAPLVAFVRTFNDVYDAASLQQWADYVCAGGAMDPEMGGANGAWLGDVLTRAGFDYQAFDIFEGYKTEFFDLNQQALASHHHGAYDVVLNFGTTEHLLGQLNAFKVIHEATAVGGWIIHDLPMTGYMDHGYFCYNPMLFMHLATANGYEIHTVKFSGGVGDESIDASLLARYRAYDFVRTRREEGDWLQAKVPTASILVIFRKTKDAPFRMGLETSTTAGAVRADIASSYGVAPDGQTGPNLKLRDRPPLVSAARSLARMARNELRDMWRRLRRRDGRGILSLWGKRAQLDLLLEAYYIHLCAAPNTTFPKTDLLRALQRHLANQQTSTPRMPYVSHVATREFPLLSLLDKAEGTRAPPLTFDGVERALSVESVGFEALLAAYGQYYRLATVDQFPLRLEAALLLWALERFPYNKRLHVRTGQVMGRFTPAFDIRMAG